LKAEFKPRYDTKRQRLKDIIPLAAPFTILIEPTRYCNFKCFYCLHSTRGIENGEFKKTGYAIKHMDFSLYKKCLNDISEFTEKPKRIVFSGLGEPLMNPAIVDMIELANKMNIAQKIDLITNASLLTPKLSDALISAGMTGIQISLQGLDAMRYKEVSGMRVNFDRLIENLNYLYSNKGNCSVFIKIIDALLDGEQDKERFFTIFGEVCDQIFIEHLITLQHQMGDLNGKADNSKNFNNEPTVNREVCPVIFYILQIGADGDVFPCPVSGLPKDFSMGDVNVSPLNDIWNGEKRKSLMRSHLNFCRKKMPVCSECEALTCIIDENEYLDNEAQRLIQYFQ